MNRRMLLTGLASASALLAGPLRAQTAATPAAGAKTYVLVHGAWGGGWIWRDVTEALRQQGHVVVTPTQTGLG